MRIKNKQISLLFGSNSWLTNFGLAGCAKGIYTGGYERFYFGIKGLIGLEILEAWGNYRDWKTGGK